MVSKKMAPHHTMTINQDLQLKQQAGAMRIVQEFHRLFFLHLYSSCLMTHGSSFAETEFDDVS